LRRQRTVERVLAKTLLVLTVALDDALVELSPSSREVPGFRRGDAARGLIARCLRRVVEARVALPATVRELPELALRVVLPVGRVLARRGAVSATREVLVD